MIGLPTGFTAEHHDGEHDTIIHCNTCHMRWLHEPADKCSVSYRQALKAHKQSCEGIVRKQRQSRTRGHSVDRLWNQ